MKMKDLDKRQCKLCKKDYQPKAHNQKFCTRECTGKYWEMAKSKYGDAPCVGCGDLFNKKYKHHVYCSKACYQHTNNIKRITGQKWECISEFCLERDGYKCTDCGTSDKLHIHHIMPISFGGKDDFENLITLCSVCHVKAHTEINKTLGEKSENNPQFYIDNIIALHN